MNSSVHSPTRSGGDFDQKPGFSLAKLFVMLQNAQKATISLDQTTKNLVSLSPVINVPETALLSEPALAEDWNRPEEDKAWSYLLQVSS